MTAASSPTGCGTALATPFASSGAIDCVWAGGHKVVEAGHHRLRQTARERFNAAVRRLVA